MKLIFALIDYIRLRWKGLKPSKAWQVSYKPDFEVDIIMILVVLILLAYLIVDYVTVSYDYEVVSSRYSAVVAVKQRDEMAVMVDKMELVAVACLNGESVVIDGVDKPCKFGRYVNGREVF